MAVKKKIEVLPVVAIDGQYYNCDDDVMPLDGVQVRWGRSGMLDKPQPATATIQLLDKSGAWHNKFRNTSLTNGLIGRLVFLQANLYRDGSPNIHRTWTWFKGTINKVSVKNGPKDPKTNRVIGVIITIEATSPEAILGEVRNPSWHIQNAAWAQDDTLLTRANYLRNDALPYAGISEMFFKPTNQGFWCSSTGLKDKTVGSLMDEFYASQATVPCYSPKDNCIRDGQQFYGDTKIGLYRYSDGYVHVCPRENPRIGAFGNDTDRYYGTSVSGALAEESGGEITREAESAITHWYIKYWSRERGYDWARMTYWAGSEFLPRKVWEISTWLENDIDIDVIFNQMSNMMQRPLKRASHPSVNFNTHSNDGSFESVVQAMNFIMAGERQYLLYVTGSEWTEHNLIHPVFGVVGGVIRLENQQWDIDLQLQPYGHTSNTFGDAKWSTIPYQMDWGDAQDTAVTDGFEHGVTWLDTAFIQEPQTIRTWSDD